MYGTIARMRVKAGLEKQLIERFQTFEAARVPGTIAVSCYRMDGNAQEYYIAVIFESKEAYRANAESPEQDQRYRQMLPLLESEPEWHDGELIYTLHQALPQALFSTNKSPAPQPDRSSP